MHELFNFETLTVGVKKETKTLLICFKYPDDCEKFSHKMIEELEKILAWSVSHLEINSILFESSHPLFSKGLDLNEYRDEDFRKLSEFSQRLYKLIYSLFFLPQTVVLDVGHGAEFEGSEFLLGADLRVAHVNAQVSFKHLSQARVPASGGLGLLSTLIPHSFVRDFIMLESDIKKQALKNSGLVTHFYTENTKEDVIEAILEGICAQNPIARMQAKRGLLESIGKSLEHALKHDESFAKAALITDDWKRVLSGEREFTQIKAFKIFLEEVSKEKRSEDLRH